MAEVYSAEVVEELAEGLRGLLPRWGLGDGDLRLLTVSENATFRVDAPARAPVILRVHRPGYHSKAEIASELAWIEALRLGGVVRTPAILTANGCVQILGFEHRGEQRHVVAFDLAPGVEPQPGEALVPGFRTLGGISARLHGHVRQWARPRDFMRKHWTYRTIAGDAAHWGPWQAALGLTPEGARVLERLSDVLQDRTAAWGTGPDRYGLIHADLRLANLLLDGDALTVIDFDDCGFGWFLYDFAAAVSFIEDDPLLPQLMAAWVEGYRGVAPLGGDEVEMLPTFVMLRRLQLTAWIASHSETPTAQEMGPAFTDTTVALAEQYLAGRFLAG